ncbi:MAG: dihydrolipoamide acetyltransferase family protein [Synechococcus sp.]|uniref:dihydrolipoamide acetyltransferase family protein n=1 Tax=Synechococcus sp. PROS-9-1 TaxID=1968775 RepID=UPI000B6FB865|nr:dihydrolipoamide acetyltransferase family protein [Synechococcus sp. PROS-9-1]MBC8169538.1 2-oxo acid dehydrogenase subunit E2 [Synechococcus sp.]RCL57812.1 MAG: 2-oxo acid dehydrogenase subunit E2 [Synechococcus sp. MED-G68]RPF75146.1 MAG: 2-oxo acid dehydrogenase subunit E2 [Synechococcus sp. TMED66]
MATHDIFMPALSSTMTEGKIVEWLKQPGDKVERGESVLVVESDKADMDVESFQEGYLAAVLMPAGSTAPVGETIGLIVETEAEIADAKAKAPTAAPSAAPTAPAAAAPAAPAPPAAPLAPAPVAAPAPISAPVAAPASNGRLIVSPRARKLASQMGVDLAGLRGTGPNGRIQAEDVEKAAGRPVTPPRVGEGTSAAAVVVGSVVASPSAPAGNSFGAPGETVAFNTLQAAVNRNMEASLAVPCFRVGYTITTDKLDAFYKQVKPKGVTMTALLAKAVAVTLARHPQVNAATTASGMSYPAEVNVAVAVAMEDGGLITPVLRNADRTDLYELSRQWGDLVKRSRSKQLQPEEYSTGTFTLSNLGMFGVDRFDAILPPGTGAILAVAASRPTVVAGKDGSIAVKRQMQVNLTADHRVIYGADGAAFLKDLAELIDMRPESLAL